jgi:hypothetical protein
VSTRHHNPECHRGATHRRDSQNLQTFNQKKRLNHFHHLALRSGQRNLCWSQSAAIVYSLLRHQGADLGVRRHCGAETAGSYIDFIRILHAILWFYSFYGNVNHVCAAACLRCRAALVLSPAGLRGAACGGVASRKRGFSHAIIQDVYRLD